MKLLLFPEILQKSALQEKITTMLKGKKLSNFESS